MAFSSTFSSAFFSTFFSTVFSAFFFSTFFSPSFLAASSFLPQPAMPTANRATTIITNNLAFMLLSSSKVRFTQRTPSCVAGTIKGGAGDVKRFKKRHFRGSQTLLCPVFRGDGARWD